MNHAASVLEPKFVIPQQNGFTNHFITVQTLVYRFRSFLHTITRCFDKNVFGNNVKKLLKGVTFYITNKRKFNKYMPLCSNTEIQNI